MVFRVSIPSNRGSHSNVNARHLKQIPGRKLSSLNPLESGQSFEYAKPMCSTANGCPVSSQSPRIGAIIRTEVPLSKDTTVGFSEQDLLVDLVASGISDAVDMHDNYFLYPKNSR